MQILAFHVKYKLCPNPATSSIYLLFSEATCHLSPPIGPIEKKSRWNLDPFLNANSEQIVSTKTVPPAVNKIKKLLCL